MPRNKVGSFWGIDDEKTVDKILNILFNKNMAMPLEENKEYYIVFLLTENRIQLAKQKKVINKKLAEITLRFCSENDIEYIEKNELKRMLDFDDKILDSVLDYLSDRNFAYVEKNEDDGKLYVTIY